MWHAFWTLLVALLIFFAMAVTGLCSLILVFGDIFVVCDAEIIPMACLGAGEWFFLGILWYGIGPLVLLSWVLSALLVAILARNCSGVWR